MRGCAGKAGPAGTCSFLTLPLSIILTFACRDVRSPFQSLNLGFCGSGGCMTGWRPPPIPFLRPVHIASVGAQHMMEASSLVVEPFGQTKQYDVPKLGW